MKEITLHEKEILIPGQKPITASSLEMIQVALEGAEINRKGLARIGKVLKILDKINHAKEMTLGSLSLEDAEFDIVYESVEVWRIFRRDQESEGSLKCQVYRAKHSKKWIRMRS